MLIMIRKEIMKYMIKFSKFRRFCVEFFWRMGILFGYVPSRGFTQFLLLSHLIGKLGDCIFAFAVFA